MLLSDKQRDEILIRLDERVEQLQADMEEAKGEKGFARCQLHQQTVNDVKGSLIWFKRTAVGTIVGAVVIGVFNFLWGYMSRP